MLKRSRKKRPTDVNVLAAEIIAEATAGDAAPTSSDKNPAAVALGKLGGLKGGPARAAKMSARRRKEIAVMAARARWAKRAKG